MKLRQPKPLPEWLRRRKLRRMREQFVRDYERVEMPTLLLIQPRYHQDALAVLRASGEVLH